MKINFEKRNKTFYVPRFEDVKIGEIFVDPETTDDEEPSFWVKYSNDFAVRLNDGVMCTNGKIMMKLHHLNR